MVAPSPPCGMVWVRVFLRLLPASLGLLLVFGILIPMMIMMMITIFIISSNILMFRWLVVGCLLPTCLANDTRFIDRRATIFVAAVALEAIAVRLLWASCHRDRACQGTRQLPCLRPSCRSRLSLGSVHSHKIGHVWDAILVTVDGFGGLTCESCRKKCTVTRIGRLWEAILVTDDGFAALKCKSVRSHTDSAWGVFGCGGDTVGGGGVGEPRTGIVSPKALSR